MRIRLTAALAAGILWFTLAGCDSFSVLGEFQRGVPLSLTLQQASLLQGGTTTLFPSGGKAPYSFGVVAGNIYYSGTLGSISGETYTAGTSIGTVIIHLTDSAGASADAVATIIPPAPTGFNAAAYTVTPAQNDILLSWAYSNTALISGFIIQRSTDGVNFTTVTTQPFSATSYIDSPLNHTITYYYQMFAVSGTYQSSAVAAPGTSP